MNQMFLASIRHAIIFIITTCYAVSSLANGACFINYDNKRHPIRLKFTYSDYVQGAETPAKIKYEKGSSEIDVKYLKDEIISIGSRMNTAKTTYVEIIEEKKTGYYYLISDGAMPIELIYKNSRKKKAVVFNYDHAFETHDKCQWETQK